jgi:hypothetical protein
MDKELIIENSLERLLAFALFLAIALLAPIIFHHQFLTGPIVNAVLFLSTFFLGPYYGALIGLLPSGVALATGLLPLVLWPMIGFIMLSNSLLVFIFSVLRKKDFWLAVILSSLAKFAFLYGSSFVVLRWFLDLKLSRAVSQMTGLNQLYTALLGGLISFLVLKTLKLYKEKNGR